MDTGGTFTDCIAIDPRGRRLRVKVLSSSALRARIAAPDSASEPDPDPRRVTLRAPWEVPDGFFRGFRFRLLTGGGATQGEAEPGAAEALEVIASQSATPASPSSSSGPSSGLDSGHDSGHAAEPPLITLTLAHPLAAPIPPGTACELLCPEEAPVLAARLITRTPMGEPLPPIALRLATTRGTNALLERRGGPVALLITRGFGDLLEIGTQQRPDLFALEIEKPQPLADIVIEIDERLAADGSVLRPLDPEAIRPVARELAGRGIHTAAIAFLHSYRNPEHEEITARVLREEGIQHISASAALAPLIKLLPRAETAVVDAYLAPVIGSYLRRVEEALSGTPPEVSGTSTLHIMTSAGGLVRAAAFHPKDSLLSGPAGGVVGAARAGRAAGFESLIAFDMGGTSTDVARYDGDHDYVFEHRVGDAHLVAPALAIESVAAGGGSVCHFDGSQLKVGPESGGAYPGPACYGAGGPLTVTDVNLLLGRLAPARFEIPINRNAAERALGRIQEQVERAGLTAERRAAEPERILAGFLAIANERMAGAIRAISLARGYDPTAYTLVAFGGAGGQHACAVAGLLGIRTVLIPAEAGLLSAAGLGAALIERFAQRQVLRPLAEVAEEIQALLAELSDEARRAVRAEGVGEEDVEIRRHLVHLRLAGQEAALVIEWGADLSLPKAFAAAYRDQYGYPPPDRPVEVESLRVVASSRSEPDEESAARPPELLSAPEALASSTLPSAGTAFLPSGHQQAYFSQPSGNEADWLPTPLYDRDHLPLDTPIAGPALLLERHATTVLPPGWAATRDPTGALVLKDQGPGAARGRKP